MPHFAIGDLRGFLDPLNQLLEFIPAGDTDTLVFLGDCVDGGPDVKGVLDRLIEIQNSRRAVFFRGNHDRIMLDARAGRVSMEVWEGTAGEEGLRSYGAGELADLFGEVPDREGQLWDGPAPGLHS